jgi:hypothetical protein
MVDGEAMGGIHVVQKACGLINHERIDYHIE